MTAGALALATPAGAPHDAIARVHTEVSSVEHMPDVRETMAAQTAA